MVLLQHVHKFFALIHQCHLKAQRHGGIQIVATVVEEERFFGANTHSANSMFNNAVRRLMGLLSLGYRDAIEISIHIQPLLLKKAGNDAFKHDRVGVGEHISAKASTQLA